MSNPFPWKKVSSEVVHKNPWWEYRKDVVKVGRQKIDYYNVHTKGAVYVVPITDDGKIVFVRQPRYLPHRVFWEFPGGGIKVGQTPEQAARAEVREETGYRVKKLVKLGEVASWIGVTDEMCHLFLAHVGANIGTKHEPMERGIEVVTKDIAEMDNMFYRGAYWDSQSVCAWFMARKFLLKE